MFTYFKSFNETLQHWAAIQPNKIAYTFLTNGEDEEQNMTYAELDQRAKAIAATLQMVTSEGDRVALLFPSSLEFVSAFFGCLYAGVIAVPVFHKVKQNPDRLWSIIEDAEPVLILTNQVILTESQDALGERFATIKWQTIERITDERAWFWQPFSPTKDTTAFLQYTSGSTSAPKGVMISHDNLLYQHEMIREATGCTGETRICSWLPLYHDMGLIGKALFTTYLGCRCIFMSPISFLKRPLRWLEAIDKYRADLSSAPNFAYDLILNKSTPEEIEALDLSCWRIASCGAEPVRSETMQRFAAALQASGFAKSALFPCYGLAEATLMVTGTGRDNCYQEIQVDQEALEKSRVVIAAEASSTAQTLVSSGRKVLDQELHIVNSSTGKVCQVGEVGEIWVAGRHIAQGYWKKPEVTKERLQAKLPISSSPFLRTGDLGFLHQGELFVTGRIKDLIKIRGRGIHPHDLEFSIQNLQPQWSEIRSGGVGVFAIEKDGQEKVAAFVEVNPRRNKHFDPKVLCNSIRQTVSEQFELALADVVLIKAGTLPKTTSGKIQRHACRRLYVSQFKDYFQPLFQSSAQPKQVKQEAANCPKSKEKIAFTNWLAMWLAEKLGISVTEISTDEALGNYGLDSLDAIELVEIIERKFEIAVSNTLVYDCKSIKGIVDHLFEPRQLAA